MRLTDAYRLTNMVWWRKLLATVAIVTGGTVFLVTWFVSKMLVGWVRGKSPPTADWADSLANLAWGHPMTFSFVLVAHLGGLAIVFSVSVLLFRLTTIRGRARKALIALAASFALWDLAAWLLVPVNRLARHSLVPLSAIEALLLGWMLFLPLKQMWFFHRWKGRRSGKARVVFVGGGFGGLLHP